jgi:hypothetical protein
MKRTHYHKYERLKWANGGVYYKCMEVGCSHYLPVAELAIGRESVCWGCDTKLVPITKEMVIQGVKHPLCDKCKEERKQHLEQMSQIGEK